MNVFLESKSQYDQLESPIPYQTIAERNFNYYTQSMQGSLSAAPAQVNLLERNRPHFVI